MFRTNDGGNYLAFFVKMLYSKDADGIYRPAGGPFLESAAVKI